MSLTNDLTVAALPLDIIIADKSANLANVQAALQKLPEGTDLLVLPELFSTAFIADPSQARALAEDKNGPTMTAIHDMAREFHIAIAGSYLATGNDMLYNRAFLIEPSGDSTFYDKRHLLCLSEESEICTQGMTPPSVARYRGWNIALSVCYDLRFPVWMRNRRLRYDLMVIPANWPDRRKYAWQHLLIARAIENQACIIGANRSGKDKYGHYNGSTFAYDHEGQPVGEMVNGFFKATFSKSQLQEYRRTLPFWKDAD